MPHIRIRGLVNVLLHESHSLSPGERELIATYVHDVKHNFGEARISEKLRRCWRLRAPATLRFLIAAVFCMCNRPKGILRVHSA